MEQIVFYFLAFTIIASALGVVAMRNIFHNALCLGLCTAAIGGIFALTGSDFLFAAQILIYTGGIAVIILFAALISGKTADFSPAGINEQWLAAVVICAVFLLMFWKAAVYFEKIRQLKALSPTAQALAETIFIKYAVPFEIISLILAAAIIAATMFARSRSD